MRTADVLTAKLRANPADLEAYEELKALYRAQGDFASLVNLIAGWAGWVTDDRASSRAYVEVADVLAQQLGETAQAEAFYLEALRRDPLNVAGSEALQALWETLGEFTKLADFLQDQVQGLARLNAPQRQLAVLRYRLGELWSKRFGRNPEALHHYRKALELDPGMLRAMYEARQLCLADGDMRGATELYDREAATETNPERRVALLLELAALYRDQLNDYDGAVSAMQRAHSIIPADASLGYELGLLLIQRAERVDQRTAQGDYAQMADLMCGVASMVDAEQAIGYLETALDYAPGHERALSELERVLGSQDDDVRLATRWVAYLAAAPNGRGAARRRTALARAYASQGQIEDAVFCLTPAVDAGFAPAVALLAELQPRAASRSAQAVVALSDDDLEAIEPAASDDTADEQPLELPRARMRDTARPPSREDASSRATTDFNDIKTQVGEPDLIDSLREAAAKRAHEQPARVQNTPPPRFSPEADTREVPPQPGENLAAADPDEGAALLSDAADVDAGAVVRRPSFTPPSFVPPESERETVPEPEPVSHPATATADTATDTATEPDTETDMAPEPEPDTGLVAVASMSESERKSLRQAAAQLAREQRQDEAAAAYESLLAADPRDREAFAFLDAFYRRRQDYPRRAQLLEQSANTDGLPSHVRVTRLREAAGTYEARIKDYAAALRCFRLLGELEPENDDVVRAQKRLLERAEQWDEFARVLEAELARIAEAEPKLPLLRKLAALHRDKRNDRDAAADVLERMLMLRPDDRATRDALIEDLLSAGREDDALPLLERKVEEAPNRAQKLALLQQVALLLEGKLADDNRAFAVYERMLVLSPGDAGLFAQLERIDEKSGNHKRLLATLERRVAIAPAAQAAPLLARMAQIAETALGDVEQASDLLSRAVDAAPDQPEPLRALCELYQRSERYDDLVELLRERVVMERSPEARVELHRRIAQVIGTQLHDRAGALDAWRKLLQIKEDREALEALLADARDTGNAEQLVELLARMAAIESSVEQKRDLTFERAQLLVTRLGRPDLAVVDLSRLLIEIDPGFEPAYVELERASEAASEYSGLARVLEQRLTHAVGGGDQIALAQRLADLYEHKLADPDRAAVALSRWAGADANNPEPFRRLCPLLSRARRYPELVTALDALTTLEPTPEARQRAAIQAADLAANKLKDVDGAWRRLLPLAEAGAAEAVDALIALAQQSKRLAALYDVLEGAGQIDKLLALLRSRAAREQDPPVRATLLRRTAQVLIEYANDEKGAAEAYRRLLEFEEDVDALRFLQSLSLRNDDPETLADVLKRLAALEQDAAERLSLLFEHARVLHTRLQRAGEAIPVLQRILSEDADHESAYEELVAASESARDYATLATTLEQMLGRTRGQAEQIALAARLSDVCEHELRDPARAINALLRYSEADRDNPDPHRRLLPLLRAAARERELLHSLDALSRLEADRGAQIEATLAAADLARSALQDAPGAWQRLIPLLPEAHPAVDRALHSLSVINGWLDQLYAELERCKRHDTLVLWLRERVGAEPDPAARTLLLRRMARTLSGPLADEEGAERAFAELLALDEDAEALEFLRARALQRDDAQLLGNCLQRLAALEQNPSEKRDLLYDYAHLLRARLHQPAQAIAVLRAIIEQLDPNFEPAFDELIEACEAVPDHETLSWALEHTLAGERDPERRVEVARKLAELCEADPQRAPRAIAALRIWAEAAPADPEPHRRLARTLTALQLHDQLLVELDALCELDVPVAAENARLQAAELAFDRLGNADGAWRRLLPLANVGNERAEALLTRVAFEGGKTAELSALYQAADRYDDLIAVLRDQAERATDPHAKADLYRRCARVLKGPLGDELAAAEAYRELLGVAEDVEALTFLRVQALRMDDPNELADMAERLARLVEDRDQKRDFMFERALLLGDRLDQPERAVQVLRTIVLELDPRFAPAIEELVALSETAEDYPNLALGLHCQLTLAGSLEKRAEIAERLADLHDDKLQDPEKARAALIAWRDAAPRNPEPLRRLRPQLERDKLPRELIGVLDALAACEQNGEARIEAALAAASLAATELDDAQGAWQRLSPLVLAREPRAERAAHELCGRANLWRALSNAYVLRAQAAAPDLALADWQQAAAIYEKHLNEPNEALEAMLRALALDMQNRELLGEIERLSALTSAWERLARVYAKLQQQAGPDARIELLARHAALLEQNTSEPAVALERLLEVCRLAPQRRDLLERAEALAVRAGTHAELIWIYEKFAAIAENDAQRIQDLLRAARVADVELKDREHALRDITRALLLTERTPESAPAIEALARELDAARPELGAQDAQRALVRTHMELAQQATEPFGPALVRRAARLLSSELGDDSAAFDALKQGATRFPHDLELYEAFEQTALKIKRLDALDAHLARGAQTATDPVHKRVLLQRRGTLLATHLNRHAKAAEVYRELLALDPDSARVFDALRDSLRQAARYQELLKAYTERLARTDELNTRLLLMREMAKLWEVELRNRPSAVEVWREVTSLAPDDEEARAALSRLS